MMNGKNAQDLGQIAVERKNPMKKVW